MKLVPYKKRKSNLPHSHPHARNESHVSTQRRWPPASLEKRPQPGTYLAGSLILDTWPPEVSENECLLSKSPDLQYFVMAALVDKYTQALGRLCVSLRPKL